MMSRTTTLGSPESTPKLDEIDRRSELSPQFAGKRYISVETFKRDGQGVKTPVWFVEESDRLYVWTSPISGKAKRIRNNPKVRIAPCSATGRPKGTWINAEAQIIPAAQVAHTTELFRKKYGLQFWLTARLNKGEHAVIELNAKEAI